MNKRIRLFLLSLLILSASVTENLHAQGTGPDEISMTWQGQLDPRWGEVGLGDSKSIDIAGHGCALTATSMILNFHGVQTDPLKLNKWLLKNSGYEKGWDDESGAYLGRVRMIWDRIAEGHKEIAEFRRYDFTALPADLHLIKGYLAAGIPIIAEVLRPGGIPHFVVLTGFEGNEFLIKDPLNEQTRYLSEGYNISDSHGSGAGRNIFGVRIFTGED